ncbi:MAG: aminotransferase class I/II-fold pyridoxal phosphate-dependent enzyme [Bacteroidota bacterium]
MIPSADRLQTVTEYYFSRKLAEIRQMIAEGKPVINLGIGNPDLPPPPAVVDRLQSTASLPDSHGYQPYQGLPALREAMAAWYQTTYGVVLDPATQVLPLMGSKEGIFHVSMAFVNPGDGVLIPNPGYPTYAAVSRLVGAEVFTYSLRADQDWQIDIEALRKLPLDRIKLFWLNTPHMPTGQVQSTATLKALLALAKEHNFLVINDNPYSLILSEQPHSLLQLPEAHGQVLELNSLSKSHHMAGWRVGWLAGPAAYVKTVLQVKSNQDSGMFKAVQEAAVAALQTPMSWHAEQNAIYSRRKAKAVQLLTQLGCTPLAHQQGMFVWATLPTGQTNAEDFADGLLYNQHVFVPPGTIFGTEGQGYVRVSLCVPEATYDQVIQRIA